MGARAYRDDHEDLVHDTCVGADEDLEEVDDDAIRDAAGHEEGYDPPLCPRCGEPVR